MITSKHLPEIVLKPFFMPLFGLLFGFFFWVVDACIDVFVLDEEQSLLENLLNPDELTELWMRTLVVMICLVMGLFSRYILLKHVALDKALLNQKNQLEKMVEQRTQELMEKTSKLEILANTDPLTGLYNRRKFNAELHHEIQRFHRYSKPLCLILLDIDYFKKINDTYGHDIGDNVIIEFARLLKDTTRHTDSVARWGGEEFMLLSIEVDLEQAISLAEKLQQRINQTEFELVGNVSCSIGIAQIRAGDGGESILKRVDKALYAAKQRGRNRIETYTESENAA